MKDRCLVSSQCLLNGGSDFVPLIANLRFRSLEPNVNVPLINDDSQDLTPAITASAAAEAK